VIQILASKGAVQPFHERMGQRNLEDAFDFRRLQHQQIVLPLVEPIKRIVILAEILWHPSLYSNSAVEHPTKCATIDRADMDAEPNDPARKFDP
jgi:hypothetical protein